MSCSNSFGGHANDGCKKEKVQDKVCHEFLLVPGSDGPPPSAGITNIYMSNVPVSATGFITFESSSDPTLNALMVNFYFGVIIIKTLGVGFLGTVSFTVTDFNRIEVINPNTGVNTVELSLTPRYNL